MLARKHRAQYGHSGRKTSSVMPAGRGYSYRNSRITSILRLNRDCSGNVMPITPLPNHSSQTRMDRAKQEVISCVGGVKEGNVKKTGPCGPCASVQLFGSRESGAVTEQKKLECSANDPLPEMGGC
jgi:hypothetical protein